VEDEAHPGLDLAQLLFRFGQPIGSRQKVAGDGLCVAAAQKAARHKVIGNARKFGGVG